MTKLDILAEKLSAEFANLILSMSTEYDEITIQCNVSTIKSFLLQVLKGKLCFNLRMGRFRVLIARAMQGTVQ